MRLLFLIIFISSGLNSYSQCDYNSLGNWFVHPINGEGFAQKDADVFFIHPTTYYRPNPSNQSRKSPATTRRLERVYLNQASCFIKSSNLYMPVYRQAHLKAFLKGDSVELKTALDTAYVDIKAAFSTYLEKWNRGRPIIIASHSQGSYHAMRLLKDFFDSDLKERLVVAYVVGIPVSEEHIEEFENLKYCSYSNETKCLVSWMSIDSKSSIDSPREKAFSLIGDQYVNSQNLSLIATNPISWNRDSVEVEGSAGSALIPAARVEGFRWTKKPIRARVDNGFVRVDGQDRTVFNGTNGNLHVYDFNLFYQDIRVNAEMRIDEYVKSRGD